MNTKNHSNPKLWKKGQFGNPTGLKQGSKNVSTVVRKLLEQDAVDDLLYANNLADLARGQPTTYTPAMVLAMIKKALEGDIRAVRLLADRTRSKITYAINHMHNIAKQWLDADYDMRVRFQAMLFPRGTTFDMTTMHFGTQTMSPLYRYILNKKDPE